jgi:hypothetical protein
LAIKRQDSKNGTDRPNQVEKRPLDETIGGERSLLNDNTRAQGRILITLTYNQKNALEMEKNGQHEFQTGLIVGDVLHVAW